MTFLALVLAALLNSRYVRLEGLWRTLIFLPYIMSGTVAAAFTFQLLLDGNAGYANRLLSFVGVSPVSWLGTTWWARISVGLLVLWAWLGYNMLIMLAGSSRSAGAIGSRASPTAPDMCASSSVSPCRSCGR